MSRSSAAGRRPALGRHYLDTALAELRQLKSLGERALEQVTDDARLHFAPDPESNSLAVLIRHLAGNMLSRWTEFLTSDGEKPDRDRDGEFEAGPGRSRAELMAAWERGWRCVLASVEALTPADLRRTVTIRGKPLSAIEAIQRQLTHYAAHVGQMLFLAKHLTGEGWRSLSIPRGQSTTWRPPA